MKKLGLLIVVLFSTFSFSQVVNFDLDANWTAGSGAFGSYQTDHQYVTSVGSFTATFTGGLALRETAGAQDGFPRTNNSSTYAWRLSNTAGVNWIASINATMTQGFSFEVRRWDGVPSSIRCFD